MQLRRLGPTDLQIAPLVLGGNVFGWTADKATSFAVLDAFLDAGLNAIDTADVYNRFAPGKVGGESETLIGEWMKDRGVRDRVVLITKGGLPMGEGMEGLGREYLPRACEASLKRLQTDRIDVYMAHRADPKVPISETLDAFGRLIDAGKVRHAGCSNYTAAELDGAMAAGSTAHYSVCEPHYNLIDRSAYEGDIEDACRRHGLGVITYFSLASGFLSGKYRRTEDVGDHARKRMLASYLNPPGFALLEKLDAVAVRHDATPAQIALAWLMARPSVTAPIASATTTGQLAELLKSTQIRLTPQDFVALEA